MENSNEPQQEANLIAEYADGIREIELEGYKTAVRKARNALFWTAGLMLLGEILSSFRDGYQITPLVAAIIVFEVGVFIGLALWTKKKPYTAIVTGIVVFIALQLFTAVALGMTEGGMGVIKVLFGGIIVKVIIFVTLFRALSQAKELQQARDK